MLRNITDFRDYRDYIEAWYEREKQLRPQLSFQSCAKKLRTTKSYLKLVMQKKRHISLDKIPLLADLMKLSAIERDVLIAMVLKEKAKDKTMKEYFHRVLVYTAGNVKFGDARTPSSERGDAVSKSWLSMAIHSLARFETFRPDAGWIHETLGGSPLELQDVQKALEGLLESGSIVEIHGRYRPGEVVFRRAHPYGSESHKIYQIALRRAIEATEQTERFRPFHFHMLSLALNYDDAAAVMKDFINFREKLMSYAGMSQDPCEVYLISNNLFAVTPVRPSSGA